MPGRPRPGSRRLRARLSLLVLAAAVAVAASALSLRAPPRVQPVASRGLPPAVVPAFAPGAPRGLGSTRHLSFWSPVRRSVAARTAPAADARVVATLSTRTPEGTRNAVAVLGRRIDRAGAPWVRVRLALLPNGSNGWVPRSALGGYGKVYTRLVVDLGRLRATLYRDGRAIFSAAVGVGMPGWSTPRGTFYIRNKLTRYRSPAYGPVAFGTSARSPRATDWPAGGFIGIHGTDLPGLLPGRVSHGCIRMRNADILELARRMPVGTPVTIR
jgi:lipoprotein-anchoring transpeptidase ErfK/SrfK